MAWPHHEEATALAASLRDRPADRFAHFDLRDDNILLAADGRILCIAITGEQAPALVRRAARSAYAVLRKPVPPLDLAATIARARGASVLRAQS